MQRLKVIYANGQLIATARKWCKFYFHEFFDRAEVDVERRIFVIYVKEKVNIDGKIEKIDDWFDTKEFIDRWSPEFVLIKVKYEL